jgi:hypothetical protein
VLYCLELLENDVHRRGTPVEIFMCSGTQF